MEQTCIDLAKNVPLKSLRDIINTIVSKHVVVMFVFMLITGTRI